MLTKIGSRLAMVELLEGRSLMAADFAVGATSVNAPLPVGISTQNTSAGSVLKLIGSKLADQITVTRTDAGLTITNKGGFSQTLAGSYSRILIDGGAGNDSIVVDASVSTPATLLGGAGNDTLVGGSGDDLISGGLGDDTSSGGAGNDILIGVGGGAKDKLTGNAGLDSFWVDSLSSEIITDIESAESNAGAIHRIAKFVGLKGQTVAKDLLGQNLADPALTSKSMKFRNFANNALFGTAGPTQGDVAQGYLGNCYLLATLSSIARVDQQHIRQSIVSLGDGTYAIHFRKGGADVFVRIDADLPTWSNGAMAYASLGAQGSTWVSLIEKAWAIFRTSASTYKSTEGGWMTTVYDALRVGSSGLYAASTATSLMTQIQAALLGGKSVTLGIGTPKDGIRCVGSHAYDVVSVQTDAEGNITGVVLRNPWGVDGVGSDGSNDGFVVVTPTQLQKSMLGVVIGNV